MRSPNVMPFTQSSSLHSGWVRRHTTQAFTQTISTRSGSVNWASAFLATLRSPIVNPSRFSSMSTGSVSPGGVRLITVLAADVLLMMFSP